MSYFSLGKKITGEISGLSLTLVLQKMQDALGKIYDQCDFSFQRSITYGGWLCPGQVANSGTFTVTPNSPVVTADAAATTAIANGLSASGVFATTLQFRNPAYSIYNIIAYDPLTNPTAATFTLDRPWMEPTSGPGQPYMLYQCYYVAPVADFRKFVEVRDTTNSAPLDFWTMTQAELAQRDPQRTEFADPSFVVPAGVDQRPNSATPGYQMFELWPQQLSFIPYSFSFRRRGIIPQTTQDFMTTTVPYPLTEELLEWRTLEVLYAFAEAQKDKGTARGAGANYLLLAQMAKKEYAEVLDKILAIDLNLNGEAFTRLPNRARPLSNRPYSNQIGQLNIGGYPNND